MARVFLQTSRRLNRLNYRHRAAVVNDLQPFGCTFWLYALVAPIVPLAVICHCYSNSVYISNQWRVNGVWLGWSQGPQYLGGPKISYQKNVFKIVSSLDRPVEEGAIVRGSILGPLLELQLGGPCSHSPPLCLEFVWTVGDVWVFCVIAESTFVCTVFHIPPVCMYCSLKQCCAAVITNCSERTV